MLAEILFALSSATLLLFYLLLYVEHRRGKKFFPLARKYLDKKSVNFVRYIKVFLRESPGKLKSHCLRHYVNSFLKTVLYFTMKVSLRIQKFSSASLKKIDKKSTSKHLKEMHKSKKEFNGVS